MLDVDTAAAGCQEMIMHSAQKGFNISIHIKYKT